jgi:hypothetical protein
MITDTAHAIGITLALDAARREGRPVRSVKDLLCDGCGVAIARVDGLCCACNDDMAAHCDAAVTLDAADGFALDCAAACDDAEGCCYLAGINPGAF